MLFIKIAAHAIPMQPISIKIPRRRPPLPSRKCDCEMSGAATQPPFPFGRIFLEVLIESLNHFQIFYSFLLVEELEEFL